MLLSRRKRLIVLLCSAGLLLGAGLLAARTTMPNSIAGESCIRCHVAEFNQGNSFAVKHPPFWDRQCTVCHLTAGSNWTASVTSGPITGNLVSQETLWRKQQVFGGALQIQEHLASIQQLQPGKAYRFRLQVAKERSEPFAGSHWLGLKLVELMPTESREISLADKITGSGRPLKNLRITSISADTLLISWDTEQPFFSWLELQELDGVDAVATSGSEVRENHPPLRDPEEVAINACYQCHPESSLGASHPVGLYGGRDVRIPQELPTVDGMLTCVTCHNPHGAAGKMLVREVIKTKLCVTCHYKYKNSSPSTMFRD